MQREQMLIDAAIAAVSGYLDDLDPSAGFDVDGGHEGGDELRDPVFDFCRRIFHITGDRPSLGLLRDITSRLATASGNDALRSAVLMGELRRKLGYVKYPKHSLIELAYAQRWEVTIPAAILESGDPKLSQLTGFIIALNDLRGDGRVIIAQEPVAALFGMGRSTVSGLIKFLIGFGFLERTRVAQPGEAAEYRWMGRED
jgi:hypothetical protein